MKIEKDIAEIKKTLKEISGKVNKIWAKTMPSTSLNDDELYAEAKKIVIRRKSASASLLQRELLIGYVRAVKLLDMLEDNGIVGSAEGAKPRKVYGK